MKKTFEDYLKEQYFEHHVGSKDEFESGYEFWLEDLSTTMWIFYGEQYGFERVILLLNEEIKHSKEVSL